MVALLIAFSSCTNWDNFEEPASGIYGTLIDRGTGEPLQVKSPGGGSIRLIQQGAKYPNPNPIDVSFMGDGHYKHTMLFEGIYKVIPWDGPFKYLGDTVTITASSGKLTEQNFEVFPFYRITASATDSTITYTIFRPETTTEKLQEIIFMVNDYEIVNESASSNTTGYYTNLWKQNVSGEDDASIIGEERTFTINWANTHLPKGKEYYFRVGARTSVAKYNYSPVIKATVN